MDDLHGLGDSIVRSFWHGRPLTGYQVLCLQSFVERGLNFELFSYDPDLTVPDKVRLRDANEIWKADRVMLYQSGFDAGSPALHANLFRYAMLHVLGGWWVDLDVVLLKSRLPVQPIYFAREDTHHIVTSTLRFPSKHDMIADCIQACVATKEAASWGQTGSKLFEPLVKMYGLESIAQPYETTNPIPFRQIVALFDPRAINDVERRCAQANFLHLYNEIWRRSEIPLGLRPPEGSYLDMLLHRHGVDVGSDHRMNFPDIAQRLAWLREW